MYTKFSTLRAAVGQAAPIIIIALFITLVSCTEKDNPFSQGAAETPVDEFTSRRELIEAVDNLLLIADYALLRQDGFFAPMLSEDTTYVRGKADGSIETEKHTSRAT